MSEDLVVLREILQRELETINAYERMLERITDASLRQIIEHVTDEEREHVSEMYELIMERDPRQRERATHSREQLTSMSLLPSSPHPEMATAAAAAGLGERALIGSHAPTDSTPTPDILQRDPTPPPPPFFPDGAWSVGKLKRRPDGE